MTRRLAAVMLIAVALDLTRPGATGFAQEPVVRFVSGTRARSIPFELFANIIFLRVRVGDSAPLSLLLDTGAYTILDTERARGVGLTLDRVGKTDSIGAEQARNPRSGHGLFSD